MSIPRLVLLLALLCSSTLLAACDPTDSINRPPDAIHMYGDAVDYTTFDQIKDAKISIQVDGKTQQFTGSYDVMMPVYHSFTIDATAPGYLPYHVESQLVSGYPDLRSPLEMRPAGS